MAPAGAAEGVTGFAGAGSRVVVHLHGTEACVFVDPDELVLVIHPDARFLRSVRLVAADAGQRAGLSVSEIDDLRIAVDELAQALLQATSHRVVFRVMVHDARVVIEASARRRRADEPPMLRGVPALLVDAAIDHHELSHGPDEMSFTLVKTAREAASP